MIQSTRHQRNTVALGKQVFNTKQTFVLYLKIVSTEQDKVPKTIGTYGAKLYTDAKLGRQRRNNWKVSKSGDAEMQLTQN